MASMLQAWVIGIPVMFVVNGYPRAEFLVLSCVIFVVCMALLSATVRREKEDLLDEMISLVDSVG